MEEAKSLGQDGFGGGQVSLHCTSFQAAIASASNEFVSLYCQKLRVVMLFLNACVLLAIDTEGQNEE